MIKLIQKTGFLLLFPIWICLLVPLYSFASPVEEVTVLIYHRFGEGRYPTTNVGTERFREQMAYLLANNYRVISLADLVNALASKKPLPDKAVVITIDDAYKSVYRNGWPILKSFGFPFTVFVYVKGVEDGFYDYMTWNQIRELQAQGVDFQDHGYSHQRMADVPEGMAEESYRSWLSADMIKSSRIMMEKLGSRPRFFAVPYGEYNQQIIDEARLAGYDAVLTQDPGSVSRYSDPFLIPREPILGNDWSTMRHFEEVLGRVDLPLTDMVPPYGNLAGIPESFGARITNPERYVPSSLGIYVSELGWLNPKVNGDIISVANSAHLNRKLNRVMIRAREKGTGRTAVRAWLLVN